MKLASWWESWTYFSSCLRAPVELIWMTSFKGSRRLHQRPRRAVSQRRQWQGSCIFGPEHGIDTSAWAAINQSFKCCTICEKCIPHSAQAPRAFSPISRLSRVRGSTQEGGHNWIGPGDRRSWLCHLLITAVTDYHQLSDVIAHKLTVLEFSVSEILCQVGSRAAFLLSALGLSPLLCSLQLLEAPVSSLPEKPAEKHLPISFSDLLLLSF